jgi:hypothetical protein
MFGSSYFSGAGHLLFLEFPGPKFYFPIQHIIFAANGRNGKQGGIQAKYYSYGQPYLQSPWVQEHHDGRDIQGAEKGEKLNLLLFRQQGGDF